MKALPPYRPWMNAVLYQSIWFLCVLGREDWIGISLALLALHLVWCSQRGSELAVMLICSLIGIGFDVTLAIFDVYRFTPDPGWLPIPWWLVVLWLGFTTTLRHALSWFIDRPLLFIVAAAIGAPLSYVAAVRLGAVIFPYGSLATALVLAGVWAMLAACFIYFTRMVARREALR